MKKIEIYTVDYCPYCHKAKELLDKKNIPYKEIDITENEDVYRKELGDFYEIKGTVTVPQIIINGKRIGGFDVLESLDKTGELDRILTSE